MDKKVKSESEVTQSCATLHDPMDCSAPGSSIHGIFQARVLEWVPFPSPLGCYYVLGIVNIASMNIEVHVCCFELYFRSIYAQVGDCWIIW